MVLNPETLVGLTKEYAIRLGEQAGYEVRVYDQREEEKMASSKTAKKSAAKEEYRSNRLNIRHLDGVVQKARIG